jgi:hypothetical protein
MNDKWSQEAANVISHYAEKVNENIRYAIAYFEAPSVLFRPKLSIDGDQWCALYGDNLQEGVAGFGNSPAEAMYDFDKEWFKKLPKKEVTK